MLKKGFTLVEVLITVGIIGVVAAITIPTLLQNTNNHKFATRFKKTVSTLAQASLTSQAQYDMDYSSLSQDSNDTTCATDAIAKGNSTMCGLFNNTLAGHSYQGVYGTVKGANLSDPYTISYTTTGFNPEGNLIYALADGTLVGFKPTAKNCRLKPGNVLSSDVITSSEGLANCVGFIDVNGVQTPNKEVTCDTPEYTTLDPTTSCGVKKAVSDVFPVVFHDGTVQPASNAANVVLSPGGKLTEAEKLARRRDFSKWQVKTSPPLLSKAQCEALPASYGIKNCNNGLEFWAGAVSQCGGVDKVASKDDLWELAKTIYTNCNQSNKYCTGFDSSKVPSGLSNVFASSDIYVWSGTETSATTAHLRRFASFSVSSDSYPRYNTGPVVFCVGDL